MRSVSVLHQLGANFSGASILEICRRVDLPNFNYYLKHNTSINHIDADGNTPLHLVLMNFNLNPQHAHTLCHALIKLGAQCNALNRELWSPVHVVLRLNIIAVYLIIISIKALRWIQKYNFTMDEQHFDFEMAGGRQ